jgi:hypothetical protein
VGKSRFFSFPFVSTKKECKQFTTLKILSRFLHFFLFDFKNTIFELMSSDLLFYRIPSSAAEKLEEEAAGLDEEVSKMVGRVSIR